MKLFSSDVLEMAEHSDTQEAQILLDAIEQQDEEDEELYKKAEAFVDALVSSGAIDLEDRTDLLTGDEEDADPAVKPAYVPEEEVGSGNEFDIVEEVGDIQDADADDDANSDDVDFPDEKD